MGKLIKITEDTFKRLLELRKKHKIDSFNKVIKFLLTYYDAKSKLEIESKEVFTSIEYNDIGLWDISSELLKHEKVTLDIVEGYLADKLRSNGFYYITKEALFNILSYYLGENFDIDLANMKRFIKIRPTLYAIQ